MEFFVVTLTFFKADRIKAVTSKRLLQTGHISIYSVDECIASIFQLTRDTCSLYNIKVPRVLQLRNIYTRSANVFI